MSLSVFIGKEQASRQYENEFFKELASYLTVLFQNQGIDGILLGHPEDDAYINADCLLITENAVVIIDFKKFEATDVNLPLARDFMHGRWSTSSNIEVKGGNSANPYAQLDNKRKRLKKFTDEYFPGFDNVNTCVIFQGEVNIRGVVPGRYQKHFSIADKRSYLSKIDSSVNLNSRIKIDPEKLKSKFTVREYNDIVPIDLEEIEKLQLMSKNLDEIKRLKDEADVEVARLKKDSELKGAQRSGSNLSLERAKSELEKQQREFRKSEKEFDKKQRGFDMARAVAATAQAEKDKARYVSVTSSNKTKQTNVLAVTVILAICIIAWGVSSAVGHGIPDTKSEPQGTSQIADKADEIEATPVLSATPASTTEDAKPKVLPDTPSDAEVESAPPATKSDTTDAGDCLIKGNISYKEKKKIYHVPGQKYYDATKIDEAFGERWFCSESEAQSAGWRKSNI